MEDTHTSKSDPALLPSGTSVYSSCQIGTGSLTSESDYSCSGEGEELEACLESDAEENSSGDSNEELNRES